MFFHPTIAITFHKLLFSTFLCWYMYFHDVRSCKACVSAKQETAGSGLNRLYNVLCLLWNILHNQHKTLNNLYLIVSLVRIFMYSIFIYVCVWLVYFQDDEDQCESGNHDCEDTCVNTVGSFLCSCSKKGYKLADDGKTCQGSNTWPQRYKTWVHPQTQNKA